MATEETEFAKDLARVKEIAVIRVGMFDACDDSFLSKESDILFAEYLAFRDKYGRGSEAARALHDAYNDVWDD